MKKQDKESLIREVTKRLDWYTMEASDEEFDADEVQTLLKLLDSLKGEEKEEELPVEEALDSFWKYCEKRQEEERILAADGKESEENRKTEPEKRKDGCTNSFGISQTQNCCGDSSGTDYYNAGWLLADGSKCRETRWLLLVDG